MDQSNRPRTRGLEASEAEEDAKLIRAALKEPSKYVKKAHQKLKQEYGDNGEDSDEREKLFYQQLPYDDDENEIKLGVKRRRGGRRGNYRRKAKASTQDGGEEEVRKHTVSARLAAMLKEELKPRIVPYNGSTIEYKQVWYKLGDIVSIQKEGTTYFAQILGFHKDQFCERYASIQWLLPRYKIDLNDLHQPPITTESFRGAVLAEDPVNMNCFQFVIRPPAHYFQMNNPNTVTRNKFYVYKDMKYYFDTPTTTLTSVSRRY